MKEEDENHTSFDRRERASHAYFVLERREWFTARTQTRVNVVCNSMSIAKAPSSTLLDSLRYTRLNGHIEALPLYRATQTS